mgnify:CR=1 FL=1
MLDFNAISEHNGWSISIVGITIVFSGLVALSIVVSQLHKMLMAWENRKTWLKRLKAFLLGKGSIQPGLEDAPFEVLEDAKNLSLLSPFLPEPFSSEDLFEMAEKRGIDIRQYSIHYLTDSGYLKLDNQGNYFWIKE